VRLPHQRLRLLSATEVDGQQRDLLCLTVSAAP
jgi:hypothetical protein